MKHIIIAGASRCGKTTLSMKLSKEGFVHYKMDSIKRGIDKNFWDGYRDDWRRVSPHMAHLIATIINENQSDIVKDKEYYIIDTCHLYPCDIAKYNLENTIIIFLGYSNIDVFDKLGNIRKYDKDVWTTLLSDQDLNYNTELGIEYSKEAKKECEELGIKYFDTSDNFEETLNEAYEYIRGELNEKVLKKV